MSDYYESFIDEDGNVVHVYRNAIRRPHPGNPGSLAVPRPRYGNTVPRPRTSTTTSTSSSGAVYHHRPRVTPHVVPAEVAPMDDAIVIRKTNLARLVEPGTALISNLLPLPPEPVATGDTRTDLDNATTHRSALANHQRKVAVVQSIGTIIGELLAG